MIRCRMWLEKWNPHPRLPGHMLGAGLRAQHVEASVARILQDNLKTHSSLEWWQFLMVLDH